MARQQSDDVTLRIVSLCAVYLRAPAEFYLDTDSGPAFVFDPPLTTSEQATLADLVRMARAGITLTLAEFRAIVPDLAGLRTYQGLASPTLAQTASALKAQSRIIRVLLRD